MPTIIRVLTLLALLNLACLAPLWVDYVTLPGEILYQQAFDPSTAESWPVGNAPAGALALREGGYSVRVDEPSVDLVIPAGLDVANAQVEVSALTVSGPRQNRLGLVCRRVDKYNYYFFVLSADGYYAIGKVKNGQAALLGMDAMQPNEAIRRDGQPNRLRIECIGDLLIFYANDLLLGAAQDADFARGDVGLLAGTFAEPGVEGLFDNLVVTKP